MNGLGDQSLNETLVTKEQPVNPMMATVKAVEWVLYHSRWGKHGPAATSGSLQERRERESSIHNPWRVRRRQPICGSAYCGKFRAYPNVHLLQWSSAAFLQKECRFTRCAVPQAHSHPPDGQVVSFP